MAGEDLSPEAQDAKRYLTNIIHWTTDGGFPVGDFAGALIDERGQVREDVVYILTNSGIPDPTLNLLVQSLVKSASSENT